MGESQAGDRRPKGVERPAGVDETAQENVPGYAGGCVEKGERHESRWRA
jgi:hypothetical protein